MKYCFRVGLYRQGLLHDLSKYSYTEFRTGVLYYQGNRSPNAAERERFGYSAAWLHHKGRNKHHFEYWIDFSVRGKGLVGNRMPLCYVIEMTLDRIAASRVYRGNTYSSAAAWEYYQFEKPYIVMHEQTKALLEKLLLMLKEEGEAKTFAYMRHLLKRKKRQLMFSAYPADEDYGHNHGQQADQQITDPHDNADAGAAYAGKPL